MCVSLPLKLLFNQNFKLKKKKKKLDSILGRNIKSFDEIINYKIVQIK